MAKRRRVKPKAKIELLRERNKKLLKGEKAKDKILDMTEIVKCCVCHKPVNMNTAKYLGKDSDKCKNGCWRHPKCITGGKEWMRNNVHNENYIYWATIYTEEELKGFEEAYFANEKAGLYE